MAAVFVVVPGIGQTSLAAIKRPALVRIKERLTAARGQGLRAKRRLLINAQARVEPAEQVVNIHKAAIGAEKAYERILGADVAFGAQDSHVRFLADEPRIGAERLLRRVVTRAGVAGEEHSEGVAIDFPAQLDRELRIDNGARVDGGYLRVKDVFAFQEERPLLFKENGKALIGGDYQLIRLDLGKVRIDGKVQHDVRCDRVLAGQTRIEFYRVVDKAARIERVSHRLQLSRRQCRFSFSGF